MRPFSKGHDDSAYGGQNFDAEKNKVPEDAAAPKLQLNRKGVGMHLVPNLTARHLRVPPFLLWVCCNSCRLHISAMESRTTQLVCTVDTWLQQGFLTYTGSAAINHTHKLMYNSMFLVVVDTFDHFRHAS